VVKEIIKKGEVLDQDELDEIADEPTYSPGVGTQEIELAHDLVKEYLDELRIEDRRLRYKKVTFHDLKFAKDLRARISSNSELNAQLFLDAVVRSLEKEDVEYQQYADALLYRIVQDFYHIGKDQLTLDYQGLSDINNVGNQLKGKEKNPFRIRYLFSHEDPPIMESVGGSCEYSTIVVKGNVLSVGPEAKNSTFVLQNLPKHMGEGAQNCTFYLKEIEEIISLTSENIEKGNPSTKSIKLSVRYAGGEESIYLPIHFYKNENKVLVSKKAKKPAKNRRFFKKNSSRITPYGKDWNQIRPGLYHEGLWGNWDPAYYEDEDAILL